ncbi:BQ2448_2420 [Microbotryum intermedium]|uniref:BQ2448_2420 protein n=1 Tax=Microbotryum intermedium TaxID=269621 RepID=A0A238F679_9BASI|nr:BQ2448_2420 [Microbotryum intermedium]
MDDDNPFMRTFVPQLPGSASQQQQQQQQRNRFQFAHSSSSKRRRSTSPGSSSASTSLSRAPSEEPLEDPLDWGGDVTLDRPHNTANDSEYGDGAAFKELEEHNVGMKMLLRLGWTKGKGLGKEGLGRLVPIDPSSTENLLGIGKAALDTRMLEASSTLSSRPRELESQRIAKETPDQREARLAKAKFEEKVKNEVAETLRKFNCDICNKSYTTVGQYDEHTNSYDHHHRARAVATKQMQLERAKANGEADKRREKERKREEKEMRKLMEKAGVKVPPVSNAGLISASVTPLVEAKKVDEGKKIGVGGGWAKFGGGGFAPIASSSLSTSTPASSSSFKPLGGFAPIASTSTSSSKPERFDSPLAPKGSGWSSIAQPSSTSLPKPPSNPVAKSARLSAPPRFRAGGTIEPSPLFDAHAPTTTPLPPRDPPPPPPPPMPFDQALPPSGAPPPPPPLPPPDAPLLTLRWNVVPSSHSPPLPAYDAPPPPPPPPSHSPSNPGSWSPFQPSPSATSNPSVGAGFKPVGLAPTSGAPPSNRGFNSISQGGFKASFKPIQKR